LYHTSIGLGRVGGSFTIGVVIASIPLQSSFQFAALVSLLDLIPAVVLLRDRTS
jgi:hypothetical protein